MVSHWGLLAMATPGSEAPSVGAAAPPTEDALGSRRSEDVRKRQREYQAAHLKKKKEEAEEAARELAVLREERGLIARSLVSALDSHERPSNLESFNLLTIAQIVAGRLIKSRSAGPCVAGVRVRLALSSPMPCRAHKAQCQAPLPALPAELTSAAYLLLPCQPKDPCQHRRKHRHRHMARRLATGPRSCPWISPSY